MGRLRAVRLRAGGGAMRTAWAGSRESSHLEPSR